MEVTCMKQYDRVCALAALNEEEELNAIYMEAPIWHHEASKKKRDWLAIQEKDINKAYKKKHNVTEMVKISRES